MAMLWNLTINIMRRSSRAGAKHNTSSFHRQWYKERCFCNFCFPTEPNMNQNVAMQIVTVIFRAAILLKGLAEISIPSKVRDNVQFWANDIIEQNILIRLWYTVGTSGHKALKTLLAAYVSSIGWEPKYINVNTKKLWNNSLKVSIYKQTYFLFSWNEYSKF